MTGPKGVGMWLWVIDSCEGGDVEAIADKAVQYGISWVAPKAQQGTLWYSRNKDKIKPLTEALHAKGIAVYPWGWVYGRSPYAPYASLATAEGNMAFEVTTTLNAEGYIFNAEHDWKRSNLNMAAEVDKIMKPVEQLSVPMLMSSYRYPNLHREFPWQAWSNAFQADRGDGWVPQIYWEQDYRTQAGSIQLQQSYDQHISWGLLSNGESFHPAPSAYSRGPWKPTTEQIRLFTEKVRELGFSTYIPWSWQHMWAEHWLGLAETWYKPDGVVIEPPPLPSPSEPLPPGAIKQVEVTAVGLNVRWGPNSANPIAAPALKRGDRVYVYDIQGSWGRIKEDECRWTHLGYTKDV